MIPRIHRASLPDGLRMNDPAVIIATGFGSGRFTPAPGTWGTLAAWMLGVVLFLKISPIAVAAAFVLSVIGGVWAIARFQAQSATHDPGMIVIDEWAGIWLALLFCFDRWDQFILAFLLFRAFDVLKPWPIGWLDRRVPGAWGVMVDDLAAGAIAGVLVYGYGSWIHW